MTLAQFSALLDEEHAAMAAAVAQTGNGATEPTADGYATVMDALEMSGMRFG